jgi:hypothetical protein
LHRRKKAERRFRQFLLAFVAVYFRIDKAIHKQAKKRSCNNYTDDTRQNVVPKTHRTLSLQKSAIQKANL